MTFGVGKGFSQVTKAPEEKSIHWLSSKIEIFCSSEDTIKKMSRALAVVAQWLNPGL